MFHWGAGPNGILPVAGADAGSSEPESFSGVPERRVKTHLIQAQSAAIARAMASICNNEQGCFAVMSGHERKTLRLSGLVGRVGPIQQPH